jgi:phosphoserine phosphatase
MEFIRRDVALWIARDPTLTMERLKRILSTAPLMNGAKETVDALRENGTRTAIVSAGIDLLAERVAIELRMDMFFANGFVADCTGRLTGDGILNVRLDGKDEKVQMLTDMFGLDKSDVVSVGNSRYDIPMFDASGLGIAFCPEDDDISERADRIVHEKDLRRILDII